jgi:hypothetical protein
LLHALRLLCCLTTALALCGTAAAQSCPAELPVQGAVPPGPLPVFPATNWWNLDIRNAPVDAASAAYINFINGGGTRRLHPDFGGEETPGGVNIYGFPYVVVGGNQQKVAVDFVYADESDGVDPATGLSLPFYPIPPQAVSTPHWIEGGAPGNVDQRASGDRHLLIIDCANRHLYELYNVWYSSSAGRWLAGSGAFFDLKSNARRPEGWTSADAAGLAIFPGLVRYDEAWNPAVTDIGHALRVTVRATNGYVWPASHRAGNTAGALPMGARLRLKASVAGADPVLRTADPNVRKIFRAMQTYGLIVADNGSDLYVSGTFDTRWNNNILNPAFRLLSANDFEVVQLGWKPPAAPAALLALQLAPDVLRTGSSTTATISLDAAAPAGGVLVTLASSDRTVAAPPASVLVPEGSSTVALVVLGQMNRRDARSQQAVITASHGSISRSATLIVLRR